MILSVLMDILNVTGAFAWRIDLFVTEKTTVNMAKTSIIVVLYIGLDFLKNERKIANNYLPISFSICFGAQKNRLT